MKKKEVKKKRSTPKTMKELTRNHKVVEGKKENPNHLEDFEDVLNGLINDNKRK
jgi:hypothetical protein